MMYPEPSETERTGRLSMCAYCRPSDFCEKRAKLAFSQKFKYFYVHEACLFVGISRIPMRAKRAFPKIIKDCDAREARFFVEIQGFLCARSALCRRNLRIPMREKCAFIEEIKEFSNNARQGGGW